MSSGINYIKHLRDDIMAIMGGLPTQDRVNRLVMLSHSIAYSFLVKKNATRVLASVHGSNASDLAYDCIADLFQKDNNGNYIQMQVYFSSLFVSSMRDEELLAFLRRLIFSKVNQGIYRLYGEADPSLSKILRNIKIAVSTPNNFSEIDRFGEYSIYPRLSDTLENYPVLDHGLLMDQFAPHTTGGEKIPELLAKLSVFLREQDEYCRIVPVVCVGLLFRSIYALHQESPGGIVFADVEIIDNDTRTIIKEVCLKIKKKLQKEYTLNKKVPSHIFENYFRVLYEILCEKYIGKNGHDLSLFECLKRLSPELSTEKYKSIHRNKIEYLLKKANKELAKQLKVQGQIP